MTTRIKHLYIHVPFCNTICFYCDFAHRVYDFSLAEKWLERLKKEINDNCKDQYETIYIGGGTPSCLSDEQLERLLNMIDPYTEEVKEYTIEVNPESLDQDKIDIFKKHHINRISIGVQSSDDEILRSLNRRHSFSDVKKGIELLKKNGLDNISVDLMYSLPGQDMDILRRTVEDILELDVPHISLYSLTIEENSVFGKRGISNLDEDIEADMYEYIDKTLRENGYIHYEVSNFCKDGYESRHNMGYWLYDDFLGLSIGASGKIGNNRYTNTRDFNRYLNNEYIRDEDLELSLEDQKFENIMMSLRTIYGLDIEEFNRKYDCDLEKEYSKGLNNRYIKIENGYLICSNFELLNNVLLDFMKD
ncbi:MAG: radical SAM family heme chaperone HemW [Erysipelotrichaceae bacterium]|nr:radical SAM family heme chaperone HemW [Erysipelotrichaceae bacterium]